MAKQPEHEQKQVAAQPECFVIMPIGDSDGYDKGHFSKVYEDIFKPACEKSNFKPVRADEVKQTNLIHLDILQKLIDSPMAICDLSSRNPNVLFELGLRQAFDKPTVLVQENGTPKIFDIGPTQVYRIPQGIEVSGRARGSGINRSGNCCDKRFNCKRRWG